MGIQEIRAAILGALETDSSKVPSTIEAAAICKMMERGQITCGLLDGPLALDNAISPAAASSPDRRRLSSVWPTTSRLRTAVPGRSEQSVRKLGSPGLMTGLGHAWNPLRGNSTRRSPARSTSPCQANWKHYSIAFARNGASWIFWCIQSHLRQRGSPMRAAELFGGGTRKGDGHFVPFIHPDGEARSASDDRRRDHVCDELLWRQSRRREL